MVPRDIFRILFGTFVLLIGLLMWVVPVMADDVPVIMDGDLVIMMNDPELGGDLDDPSIWYALEEVAGGEYTGNLYSLGQSSLVEDIEPGSRIRVDGILRDDDLLIADSVEVLSGKGGGSACELGEHRMLVMICSFQDQGAPCDNSTVNDVVFNPALSDTVKAFYTEASFGTHQLTGTVVGPYTIDYTSSPKCSLRKVARLCDQAVRPHVPDFDQYGYRFYVLPAVSGTECTGGWGSGPDAHPVRSWVFGGCSHFAFAHEYGHNLGMGHAGVPGDDYADRSDVMGGAYGGAGSAKLRHHHAAHKYSTCFVPRDDPRTKTDPSGGTYTVGVLEQNTGSQTPQVIRITAVEGSGKWAEDDYLGFRRAIGFDQSLLTMPYGDNHLDRMNIHRHLTAKFDAGWLPTTDLIGWFGDGESYRLFDKGLEIKQLSHTDAAASIRVTGPPAPDDVKPGPVRNLRWNQVRTFTWDYTDPAEHRGFIVYRNNTEAGRTPYPWFADREAASGHTYIYFVRAYDDAGNLGDASNSIEAPIP